MKKLFCIHAFLIQAFFNLIPFFMMDVFYDNMTYIGNQLNHPGFLLVWSSSCAIGLYFYSMFIWKKYAIEYSKILHLLICSGWILSCSIPYSTALPGWINDLHVWIAIASTVGFGLEWMYLHTKKESFIYNEIKTLLHVLECIFALCVFVLALAGHVNGLCELIFSFGVNAALVCFLIRYVF